MGQGNKQTNKSSSYLRQEGHTGRTKGSRRKEKYTLVMGRYTKAILSILLENSPKNVDFESVISIHFTLILQDVLTTKCTHKFYSLRWLKDTFIESCSHTSVKPLMLLMIWVQASHKTTETRKKRPAK